MLKRSTLHIASAVLYYVVIMVNSIIEKLEVIPEKIDIYLVNFYLYKIYSIFIVLVLLFHKGFYLHPTSFSMPKSQF